MYYAIDFDTRSAESKSEDGELLAEYIVDNNLELAIALVSDEEELLLSLSMSEMVDLYTNLGASRKQPFANEDEAAELTWHTLCSYSDTIPDFTPRLGKRLLKEAAKRQQDGRSAKADKPATSTKKTSSVPAKPRASAKDKTLLLGTEPKPGTKLHELWVLVDENLGEMSFEELVAALTESGECTDKLARRYTTKSVRLGHLETKDA